MRNKNLKNFLILVLVFAGPTFFGVCMKKSCPYCQKPLTSEDGVHHKKCHEKHLAKLEAERIAHEEAEAEAAKKVTEERASREAMLGITLKVRANIANIHQVFGKESNADLEEFGNNHLPEMTAFCLELQQKAEEAKQNLDAIVYKLKISGVDLEKDDTYQALLNNYENCLVKYWVLRTRIVNLYLAYRVEAISADELLETDNIESEIYK